MLLGVAIAALVAAATVLGFREFGPAVTTYNLAVLFSEPEIEKGQYPNGMAFSPSDLRSAAVIEQVYDINDLAEFGIDLQTFQRAITVSAYAPAMDSLAARYRDRLQERNLTFEEKKTIEDAYRRELAELSNPGSLISLTLPNKFGIARAVATKTLNDIPAVWADIYINRLGAFSVLRDKSGSALVDVTLVEQLDYPILFDYIEKKAGELKDRLDEISAVAGVSTLLSEKSGKSVGDLIRDLQAVREYRVTRDLRPAVEQGLSRTPAKTLASYRDLLDRMAIEMAANRERSDMVSQVVGEADRTAGIPAGGNEAGGPVPQFDGGFMDKLIDLSDRGAGRAFKEDLLHRKLSIEEDNARLREESERVRRRVAAIEAATGGAAPAGVEATEFLASARQMADMLNAIWDDGNRIAEQASVRKLNHEKRLYVPAALDGRPKIEEPWMLSVWTIAFVMLLALLGAAIGLTVSLVRRAPGAAS